MSTYDNSHSFYLFIFFNGKNHITIKRAKRKEKEKKGIRDFARMTFKH